MLELGLLQHARFDTHLPWVLDWRCGSELLCDKRVLRPQAQLRGARHVLSAERVTMHLAHRLLWRRLHQGAMLELHAA